MKNKKLKKVLSIIIYGIVGFFAAFGVICFGGLMYSKATGQLDEYLENNKTVEVTPNTYTNYLSKRAITNDSEDLTALTLSDFGNNYIIKGIVYNCCDQIGRLESFNNGLIDLSSNANGPIYNNFNNISGLYFYDLVNNTRVDITQVNTTIANSTLYNSCRELRIWFASSQYPAGWLRFDITFNSLSYYTFSEPYSYVNFELSTLGHTFSKQSAFFFDYNSVPTGFNSIFGYGGWNHEILLLQDNSYQLGYDNGYNSGVIVGKAEGIDEGYASGYDDGLHENDAYNLGYTDGHTTGVTEGYNEGYATGSTGMNSNPFNLIANAFTSVASILNIQVLPNLTLGVLIFTPLIVLIIITVVKFIRG